MKYSRNFLVLQRAATIALSLTLARVASAAPPTPSHEAAKRQADEAAKRQAWAERQVDAGHLQEAIQGWTDAWALRPNDPDLACNIGRGEFRLGHLRKAAPWLKRCVRLLPPATTREDIAYNNGCVLELSQVKEKLSILRIDVDEGDARIVVDDDSIFSSPTDEDVFVEPGEHRIRAYRENRTAVTTISTIAGREYNVALALLPPRPPMQRVYYDPLPEFEPILHPFRWGPVVAGGLLATVGLSTGLTLSVLSSNSSDQATSTIAAIQADAKSCSGPQIDPRCPVVDRLTSRSDTYSTAAIASFIASGVITAGVIGFVIYENRRLDVGQASRIDVRATTGGITGTYRW